jgi:hypothetical protein
LVVFFDFFVGSAAFFFSVVVPVVADVALVAVVPEVSVPVVIAPVPVAVIPVPVVSVELVVVVAVLEVTPVSVTAVSVLAFSSFLQPASRETANKTIRNFRMSGTPLTLGRDVSDGRSRGAIV